ncbi:TPA: hypothetical protein H1011_03065 [archaeon]|uniref:Phosphoserine phosphatase n=1 Tax=Candidatus Undinarchaeum marinum TaxID=2756141 RepID=A0A832UYT0_9ARCH|nr:hypothetical protein [Candidatus Undinarchaeum marinum]
MNFEELTKDQEKLQKALSPLNKLKRDASKLANDRDSLNEIVKKSSSDVKKLKKERDKLNESVQRRKYEREALNKQREEAKKIQEKNPQTPAAPSTYAILKKRIKSLLWKIETSGVSFKEEKKMREEFDVLSKEAGTLETQVSATRVLKSSTREASKKHQDVVGLAQKSESVHKDLIKAYAELRKSRSSANKTHGKLMETREQIKNFEELNKEDIDKLEKITKGIKAEKKKAREIASIGGIKVLKKAEKVKKEFEAGKRVDLRDLQATIEIKKKRK